MSRKVVAVSVEALSLSSAIATYYLFEKMARQHGVSDVYEVECLLYMAASNFAAPGEADVEGLKQALDDLRIDAQVTEVEL